ncbi:hypothetical protein ACIQGW_19340 [Lysinibacillus xylanilyticus]|uniref:hypothetical protein n=1 Tax=Lysinibacillus xylanilyticus TaxID=582475 RepID=UPI0037FA0224
MGGGYAKVAGKGGKTALNFCSTSKNATNAAETAAKSSENAASATKVDIPKGTDTLSYLQMKSYLMLLQNGQICRKN